MRYPNNVDVTQMMGMGYLGEVRQGPDGNLYEQVQGIDGFGNPVMFWQRRGVRNRLRRAQRAVCSPPVAQAAKLVPVAKRLSPSRAAKVLRQAGMSGYIGLGELYETPDGAVYQVEGPEDDGYMSGLGQADLINMMGVGTLGEVRQGPDGNIYQWVQGVDGLGNPIGAGFWKRLGRRLRRGIRKVRGAIRKVVGRVLPFAEKIAPFVPVFGPAVSAGLKIAKPILKKAKLAGYDGLGALYEAADGTLYQMQGFDQADEDLNEFAQADDLEGFADYDNMSGLAEEDLEGFADYDDMNGLAEEELEGLADDEEMAGFGQGYVMQDQMNGLAAYIPQQPPATRWFREPSQAPKIWESPW